MMKRLILTCLILSLALLFGLEFIPGSNLHVPLSQREDIVAYHSSTVDHLWYLDNDASFGWAVFFDLENYMIGIDSLQVTGAYVYLPNDPAGQSLKIRLCPHLVNQPDPEFYAETEITAEQGWNYLELDPVDIINGWILVDYQTNSTVHFIAGSEGEGTHSYYQQDGYYYNMAANGYSSEFLFSLAGNFYYTADDLELVDFRIFGAGSDQMFAPADNIYPEFTIRNNSSSLMDSISLVYAKSFQDSTHIDTLQVPDLNGEETLVLDTLFTSAYGYQLQDHPAQYRLSAQLYCSDDGSFANNTKDISLDSFTGIPEKYLVENFLLLNDTASQIWSEQSELINDGTLMIMNCFPANDDFPYYNISAQQRFQYYQLYGYPTTIVSGQQKIIGYFPENYFGTLESYLAQDQQIRRTFIQQDSLYGLYNDVTGIRSVQITLSNPETLLFSSYLNDLKFYAAIVEDSLAISEDFLGSTMLKIIREESAAALQMGDAQSFSFSFNLSNEVEPIQSEDNCRLVYWIQHQENKKLEFLKISDYIPELEFEVVDADDPVIKPELNLQIYPNPFTHKSGITINLTGSRGMELKSGKIYNIRGQLVRKLSIDPEANRNTVEWDGRDSAGKMLSSGIYLLRMEITDGRDVYQQTGKCILINSQ